MAGQRPKQRTVRRAPEFDGQIGTTRSNGAMIWRVSDRTHAAGMANEGAHQSAVSNPPEFQALIVTARNQTCAIGGEGSRIRRQRMAWAHPKAARGELRLCNNRESAGHR